MATGYYLDPPAKWQAGSGGWQGEPEKPFYFDCAGCKAREPEIAMILVADGKEPVYKNILILDRPGEGVGFNAMFCSLCTERIQVGGPLFVNLKEGASCEA